MARPTARAGWGRAALVVVALLVINVPFGLHELELHRGVSSVVVVADLAVLLALLFSWRLGGGRRRPTLVGVAVEDVRSGEEGSVLDRQDDGTYVVNGEVSQAGPTSVVLSLRDRDVEIHLRDHDNPVPVGGRARVRAELVG